VKPLNYFTSNECDQRVPVFYTASTNSQGERKNVMLFILESFSYAYLDPTNKQKPSTPFFDSLITHSTLYTKAFANNITSAQGLCSMLSGLPSLINQPFFGSAYANHQVDAIAIQLGKLGYSTHFAMGANEDHFGFKKGTKLLGIQHYYNGEEFPTNQHDGTWGIFDEPFLQHYAALNQQFKQPFFSTLFTISSHYPFKVPDSLQGKFPTVHHTQNEQAISYVDYSFRKYFERIQKEPWFQHTIFIFTGDHVSKENEFEQFNFYSYYHIPIFIFDPQNPEGRTENKLVQHTDLPATIADLSEMNLPVLSFGHSFYDTTSYRYTVNRYAENIIQLIDENYLIQYDVNQHKMLQAYTHHENDSLLIVKQANILDQIKKKQIPILQAYLQQYFNRLYENKLSTRR
ncbi:MAG: LTA synthase family protein, partial [Chitinophagaceae bacterium]|nr:LTA synthase family protein [Chitinophagaceae bacterium]